MIFKKTSQAARIRSTPARVLFLTLFTLRVSMLFWGPAAGYGALQLIPAVSPWVLMMIAVVFFGVIADAFHAR
jgi:hypothetical protein